MIRDLTHDDLPQLLELAREMHRTGVYAAYPMDEARVAYILEAVIAAPTSLTLGYEIKGELVGAFVGEVVQDLWVDAQVAVNQLLYVRAQSRSSRAGFCLLNAYTEWAAKQGADVLSFSVYAGINNDAVGRSLHKLGFSAAGGVYKKEIHHG